MAEFAFLKTDYSKIDRFERLGYIYTKIAENDRFVVWRMEKEEIPNYSVEVWRKDFRKNFDGSLFMHAPSDEEFGCKGWYLVGKEDFVKKQVEERFGIAL